MHVACDQKQKRTKLNVWNQNYPVDAAAGAASTRAYVVMPLPGMLLGFKAAGFRV